MHGYDQTVFINCLIRSSSAVATDLLVCRIGPCEARSRTGCGMVEATGSGDRGNEILVANERVEYADARGQFTAKDIAETKVLMTVVGGKVLFEKSR